MESYDGKINFHYIKITLNNRASRDDIVRTTSYFFMGPSLCLHITLAYNPSIIFLSINLGDANYIVSISVKTFCSMLQYIFIQLVGRRTKFRKKLCMVRQHKVYAILDSIEPLFLMEYYLSVPKPGPPQRCFLVVNSFYLLPLFKRIVPRDFDAIFLILPYRLYVRNHILFYNCFPHLNFIIYDFFSLSWQPWFGYRL
jgi:hypothetical protein